jgi:outer membrane protein
MSLKYLITLIINELYANFLKNFAIGSNPTKSHSITGLLLHQQYSTFEPKFRTNTTSHTQQYTMFKQLFSAFLLAGLVATGAMAQKIAVVDITAVLEGMPEYQKAQKQLDDLATQWRQEIAVEQDKIKGMYSKFQAEQVLLSEELKRQREAEITAKEKEVRDLQRQKFGPEGALFKKREELVKPIQDKVYDAIQQYATNRGYEYIFDKGSQSGMLFFDPKNDKTDDIKAILKK